MCLISIISLNRLRCSLLSLCTPPCLPPPLLTAARVDLMIAKTVLTGENNRRCFVSLTMVNLSFAFHELHLTWRSLKYFQQHDQLLLYLEFWFNWSIAKGRVLKPVDFTFSSIFNLIISRVSSADLTDNRFYDCIHI